MVKEQGSFVVGGNITRKDSIMASDAFETVTSVILGSIEKLEKVVKNALPN